MRSATATVWTGLHMRGSPDCVWEREMSTERYDDLYWCIKIDLSRDRPNLSCPTEPWFVAARMESRSWQ